MTDRARVIVVATFAAAASLWRIYYDRLGPVSEPFLDLIRAHDPLAYWVVVGWYYAMPAAATALCLSGALAVGHVWFGGREAQGAGRLPAWPTSPDDRDLRVVLGEIHHPVERRRASRPGWLVLPAQGLYTGIAIFGAVGSGKTSACMYPFARQILSWRAGDSKRKSAGLVLEVKGDFCHSVRKILEEAGRGDDYVEIGIEDRHLLQWNPLDAPWVDSFSLAYQVGGLINQLHGKSKDPFWQQAYTNLVRNVIELHRIRDDTGWVTLRDIYVCALNPEELAKRLVEAAERVDSLPERRYRIPRPVFAAHVDQLAIEAWEWLDAEDAPDSVEIRVAVEVGEALRRAGLSREFETVTRGSEREAQRLRGRHRAIATWYALDWMKLKPDLRTSIVESVSVFLSIFDQPDIARIFCPERPPAPAAANAAGGPAAQVEVLRALPSLAALIDEGKIVALNMPVGANPALARTIGVMLKTAWLQALLRRSADGRRDHRPAAFICDEYQNFATCGGDDPSGDEKVFALTRQAKCIPIVATQSISSIRSVVQGETWRTLLQTLRTKIFLSLSDESSAKIASEMCGQVARMKASVSFNESSAKAGVSLLSGKAGGAKASLGMSKQFSERREALFHPRDFSLLDVAEAIVLPFDGRRSHSARRCYLKPYFLARNLSWFDAREKGIL